MEMTLAKIAEIVDGEVSGDDQKQIRSAAPFDEAQKDEITFAGNPKFLKRIHKLQAWKSVPEILKHW